MDIIKDLEEKRNGSDNTLILLGNGFDLAYGLKTSYTDFYKSSSFEEFYKSEHRGDISKMSILSDYILLRNIASDKWVDLELLLYDFAMLCEAVDKNDDKEIDRLLPPELLKGVDDEYALYSESKFLYERNKWKQSIQYDDFIVKAKQLIKEDVDGTRFKASYSKLTKSIQDFIDDAVHHNLSYPDMVNLVSAWIREFHGNVITFNYTKTFDYEYERSIDKNGFDVRHVHGIYNADDKLVDCIVLGVDKSMPLDKKYNFLYKAHSNAFKNFHYTRFVNEAFRYVFYGVSMGQTDKVYYNNIFNQEDKIYEIYYHGESELDEVRSRIEELSGVMWDEFNDKNIVMMINCKSDESIYPLTQRRKMAYLKFRDM